MSIKDDKQPSIVYSCYANRSREGEQFVLDHAFSYQEAGTLILDDGTKKHTFKEGDFKLVRRNHLVKFNKLPPAHGEFKSLSVYLDQETLRNFSMEYGYKNEKHEEGKAIIALKNNPLYKGYIDSLIPYLQMDITGNSKLTDLKLKEAILLLLQINPELKNVLFDFSEPGKIDLEAFMNKNYHFNVEMKRFAYLTGRSLATFKRDFEKIFNASPSRWLLQKRLQEAYHLIRNKGAAASDIYLELGFEDLSHFSFAFKKMYGVSPSKV
jgi:AraC-like DNA-binding protein